MEIRDDKVRLGIVAPKQSSVHRKEVYEAIYGIVALRKRPQRTAAAANSSNTYLKENSIMSTLPINRRAWDACLQVAGEQHVRKRHLLAA